MSKSDPTTSKQRKSRIGFWVLFTIPILLALCVWLSPLSFVPVPWPDDSAFYFVAKDFFKWPPRWVMIPQAPFEPTYRIFNFNTMPLYPLLIGLGRFVGIDGTFGLKFWPLISWGLSGGLLAGVLYRAGLPFLGSLIIALACGLDPIHRWASVLVRPESLIGLFGMALVLGLSFGFPRRFRKRGFWDPVAALLALGAYAHFNAVHLLFPVVLSIGFRPKRLLGVAARTALYLFPWVLLVVAHFRLFLHQMTTQWTRLAVPNNWLASPSSAIAALMQGLGSPEPWPSILTWASVGLWVLIIAAVLVAVAQGVVDPLVRAESSEQPTAGPSLLPSAAWVLGSLWLWNSKPEVWFVYYIHLSLWCFAGIVALKLWLKRESFGELARPLLAGFALLVAGITGLFGYVDISQASRLGSSATWKWSTYDDFVGCIDQRLVKLEHDLRARSVISGDQIFRVWNPTFPDITVELSRKHPEWEFSRTNDFWERANLAVQHGRDVEAVVVTEMLRWEERTISAPASQHPEITSVWMTWKDYFLNRLWLDQNWKPNRYLCQRGRWQAFLFMK